MLPQVAHDNRATTIFSSVLKRRKNAAGLDSCFRTCNWKAQPSDIPCGNPSRCSRNCPIIQNGVPYGIRTRVTAVRGRCPGPLDEGDKGAASPPV